MRKLPLSCLLICIVLLFAACDIQHGTTVPPLTVPTTVPTATINMDDIAFHKETISLVEAKDGLGADYSANKDMEVAQYYGTTYAFEPSISMDDRQQCIQATKAILDRLNTNQSIQINIYSTGSYPYTIVENGVIHSYIQDWTGLDYTTIVLYGILGEYCSYGLIYGYANSLLADIYNTPLEVLSGSWNYAGHPEALDLNLLCFRSEFVDDESITSVQKIANTFVAEYIESNGEAAFLDLLRSSGNTENVESFVQTLAAYYATHGIDHTPTNILYRLGGKSYNYIVKCPYAVMYIEKDWTDANKDLCPYTYDNFLHENYSDTKRFFTINIRQMEQYQDLFALDSYNHDLKVYFTNYNYSYYNGYRHAIGLANTASFTHEYIHALTLLSSMSEDWALDGFARYYSYRYDYYGNAMSNVDYNSVPDTAKTRWIHEYKQFIGRDIAVEQDITELWHIATYVNSYDDPNDGGGYTAGSSFVAYLISRLGEEKVIEIICKTHDFGEYSYDELVADWNAYIVEKYSSYTKVK